MYGEAIVAKQQLEAVGITVDLQVTDWATVLESRAKPEEWDMFGTGHGFVPDPSQISYVGQMNQYPGWWSSESSLALAADLLAESDFDTRMPIFEKIQDGALHRDSGDQDRRLQQRLVPLREGRRLGPAVRARCEVLESLAERVVGRK